MWGYTYTTTDGFIHYVCFNNENTGSCIVFSYNILIHNNDTQTEAIYFYD